MLEKSWGTQIKLQGRQSKAQRNLRFLFGSREGSQITPQVSAEPLQNGEVNDETNQ